MGEKKEKVHFLGRHEVTPNRNFLDSSLARDLCRTSSHSVNLHETV